MPVSQELATILDEAMRKEKEYDWLEAAELYKRVSGKLRKADIIQRADFQEKIGYCLNKAALQAEDPENFMKVGQLAVEAYEAAAQLLGEERNPEIAGKCMKLNALANYSRSSLASSPSEKKRMLDECLRSGKKSLEAYEDVGDKMSYGKMCNDLSLCLVERCYVAHDWMEMKSAVNEGINVANKAIAVLSNLGEKIELLRAYSSFSLQGWYAANVVEEQQRKELAQKSMDYSQRALELSKNVESPYYIAMANWAAAVCTLLFTEKVGLSSIYAEEMLRQGTIVRDNYLRGVASYVLTFVTDWATLREPDPEKKKEGHVKIIRYAEDAIRYLQMICQDFYIAETDLFYAESYSSLGREFEASSEERRSMLEKAIEIGRDGLEHAKRSGSSDATVSTLHALSKALHFCSNLEAGKDEKVRLLEEALVHRQESNEITERLVPNNDWVRGVGKNYEGLIKAALAREESENDKKRDLLESAISDMNEGISRCKKWILVRPIPTLIVSVGHYEASFGATLTELYALTKDKKVLHRTIEAYAEAAKEFKKAKLPSRAAESYWAMAKNQDRLGKNQEAVENFENAFLEYKSAAQGTPNFQNFYLDHATYMKAWSEIERAKVAHTHEKYDAALNYYQKVANLMKPLKLWSYLSMNFLACSFLEKGEDLSRRDDSTDSIEAFKKAAESFRGKNRKCPRPGGKGKCN
jgi:tetratricopeptide (TPR) repeat protein